MINSHWFYPGDEVVLFLLMVVVAVTFLTTISLIGGWMLGRRPALRHRVLLMGLLITSLIPLLVITVEVGQLPLLDVLLPFPEEAPLSLQGRTQSVRPSNPDSSMAVRDKDTVENKPLGNATGDNVDERSPLQPSAIVAASPSKGIVAAFVTGRPVWFRRVTFLVCAIWLAGSLFLTQRYVRAAWRLRRIQATTQPLPEGAHLTAQAEASHVMGLGQLPEIVTTNDVQTPVIIGLFQPKIIIPAGLLPVLTEAEIHDILVHETAHAVRRDLWVVQLEAIATILLWPILFVHLLIGELGRAREELCDIYVLRSRQRRDYGRTLLRIARLTQDARPVALATGILPRAGRLENRVARLLDLDRDESTNPSRLASAGIVFVFLLATGIVCSARLTAGNGPTGDPPAKVAIVVESKRLSEFVPQVGVADKTRWTQLMPVADSSVKGLEEMTAQVTIEGVVPVDGATAGEPVFDLKLGAGSAESLNLELIVSQTDSYDRILYADEPLTWQFANYLWTIAYVVNPVDAGRSVETPFANIRITRQPNEAPDGFPSESLDETEDGGSEFLRNIRNTAVQIYAEMAAEYNYRLPEGKALAYLAPPFPEIRKIYYRVVHPTQYEFIHEPAESMTFHWENARLTSGGMSFGRYSIVGLLDATLGLKDQQIEGPDRLLNRGFGGDWIVRTGAKAEDILGDLETILREQLSMKVHLEFREVEREVYVATGEYEHHPLPGHEGEVELQSTDGKTKIDHVEIFSHQLVPNSHWGGGAGSLEKLLQWTGRWISMNIIDEVTKRPDRQMGWTLHGRDGSDEQTMKEDRDAEAVLQNLSRQTGLSFTKQNRRLKILFVEKVAPN